MTSKLLTSKFLYDGQSARLSFADSYLNVMLTFVVEYVVLTFVLTSTPKVEVLSNLQL